MFLVGIVAFVTTNWCK